MGAYMSGETPKASWDVLHGEVLRLAEDHDVTFTCPEGAEDLIGKEDFERCNYDHSTMRDAKDFKIEHLPEEWRVPEVFDFIKHKALYVVKIRVLFTSENRPHTIKYPRSKHRGSWLPSGGTGFAHLNPIYLSMGLIDCPVKDCEFVSEMGKNHKTTPVFLVETATHVVFDDFEAQTARIEFLYESESDDRTNGRVIRGEVLRLNQAGAPSDNCVLRCVSHDLELFRKLLHDRYAAPINLPSPLPPRGLNHKLRSPLVVVISHPHGHIKQISTGTWVGYRPPFDEANEYKKRKIADFFREIEEKCPNWQQTGYYSDLGEFMTPEVIRWFRHICRENPEMTFDEGAERMGLGSAPLPYITYNAATCPGSSGARVFVLVERLARPEWDVAVHCAHFRKKDPRLGVNQSGEATVEGRCAAELEWCYGWLAKDLGRGKTRGQRREAGGES